MGSPKALMEWHGTTLLAHTAALVRTCIDGPMVIMRAPGQHVPLSDGVAEVIDDAVTGDGPLSALATALTAVESRAELAVVCPVDMPYLSSAFFAGLLAALTESHDLAIAVTDGRRHPLPAIVRTSLATRTRQLVATGHRALLDLAAAGAVAALDGEALRRADPTSVCLRNLNSLDDYNAARADVR